ncbi:MAG TPA: 50S ribosomal protein L23 [Firmicutes bacterium]|nr:50S ribosomal protein L23 [Bacillota bacterium]
MKTDIHDVIVRPIVSEKSNALMGQGKYTFVVHPRATKIQIRQAVEDLFRVHVRSVNTSRMPGKPRRMGVHRGYTAAWKRATVTLAPGEKIHFFEGM